MKLLSTLSIGVISFIFISCENLKNNDDDNSYDESRLIIKMSHACGWCAGADSLITTETLLRYEYVDPCGDNDYNNNSAIDKDDWNELTELLDYEKFEDITLNTCYVCVDGCDTWISVKADNFYHEIRFADFDSNAIQNIKPFIEKLEDIRMNLTEN